jgi:DNA polymerase delta subunit 1
MPSATLPKKRVFGEASSARRNIVSAPVSSKKRRLENPPSSPVVRFNSSQNDGKGKLASSQQKSTFETEVLERMSQDISDLKQNNTEKDQIWGRPPLPKEFDPENDNLCFQAIEAEEGTLGGGQATVKLFGVTENGNSVLLHVKDFKHYLYVAAPVSFAPEDCQKFQTYLETQLAINQRAIHSVSLTMRENIYGFQGNVQNPFIKVTVTDPKLINKVRTLIESGNANWKGMWKSVDGSIMTYDNIQYLLRFMVDCSVCGNQCYKRGKNRKLTSDLDCRHGLGRGTGWQVYTHDQHTVQLPDRSADQLPRFDRS